MRSRQGTVLEALIRVAGFLDKNTALVDAVNKSATRRHLDEATTQLAAHGATQDGSTRATKGEVAKQQSLQLSLRTDHMRPIATVARKRVQASPEVQKALKMPRANLGPQPLLAAASGMADAAASNETVLVDGGLPAGFLDQFRAAITSLQTAISGRNGHLSTRIGSTAGLSQQETQGRHMLRVVDTLVKPLLGDDQVLIAEWRAARQIRRLPKQAAAVVPPTPPAATPVKGPATTPAPTPAAAGVTPTTTTTAAPGVAAVA